MVQRTSVVLVDDIDGTSEDVQTVSFSWEGRGYEIDLSTENYEAMTQALGRYVAAARRSGNGRRQSGTSSRPRATSDAGAIREWAAANGVEVSERGRIPAEVREKYEAAQK